MNYYLNKDMEPSGFYGYVVQWEPLGDGFHYMHLLFDLVNNHLLKNYWLQMKT